MRIGLSKRRFLHRINAIVASGLFSSLLIFFLTYYFIEQTKKAHVEAEIRKIAVETTRAELENQIKQIVILQEEMEAAKKGSDLFSDILPKIMTEPSELEIQRQNGMNTFFLRQTLKNSGRFEIHIQTDISIYEQGNDKEIKEYEWYGYDDLDMSPGRELRKLYEIRLTNNFSNNLVGGKKRFYIVITHALSTDDDAVEFIVSKVSSDFIKDTIKKKSKSSNSTAFRIECSRSPRKNFSCSII